jgi:hypothetical protein
MVIRISGALAFRREKSLDELVSIVRVNIGEVDVVSIGLLNFGDYVGGSVGTYNFRGISTRQNSIEDPEIRGVDHQR